MRCGFPLFARRLLELASNYFDLSAFPEGETKRALLAIAKKRIMSRSQSAEEEGRKSKKAKRS